MQHCEEGAGQASPELGSPEHPLPWIKQHPPELKEKLGMRPGSIFNAKLQYFGFSAQL